MGVSDGLETEQPVDLDGAGMANSRHLVTGVVEGAEQHFRSSEGSLSTCGLSSSAELPPTSASNTFVSSPGRSNAPERGDNSYNSVALQRGWSGKLIAPAIVADILTGDRRSLLRYQRQYLARTDIGV